MKILIDIIHPAHVHFFYNSILSWKKAGHEILITARNKEIVIELLKEYKLDYKLVSRRFIHKVGMLKEMIIHQSKLYLIMKNFQPDVAVSIAGVLTVHAAKLLGVKTVTFTDSEFAKMSNIITLPYTDHICTPDCFYIDFGKKHIKYKGYHELAYLHPEVFKPDINVLKDINIDNKTKFFIIRFVSWSASHDFKKKGFSMKAKKILIKYLEKFGKIFITSESKLPKELLKYKITISPKKIHHLLYFSHIYIGEGVTMASESGILGTPSVLVSPLYSGTTIEQEKKYQILYSFKDEYKGIDFVKKLLFEKDLKKRWREKNRKMLKSKINVSKWVTEYIESFSNDDNIKFKNIIYRKINPPNPLKFKNIKRSD